MNAHREDLASTGPVIAETVWLLFPAHVDAFDLVPGPA